MGVYNNDGSVLENSKGPHLITISALSGPMGGDLSKSTSFGIVAFTGLRILNGGIQCVRATNTLMLNGESVYFEVEAIRLNRIIVTSSDTSPDAFIDFTLNILLYDQLENPWKTLTSVTISSTSNHISGALSGSTSTSSLQLQVHSTESGIKIITVSSGTISSTCTVNIQQNLLKISNYSPSTLYSKPIFTTTSFDCTICVINSQTDSIITSNGPFIIQIKALVNELVGTLTKSTSNGCASFTSLKVANSGTTRLQANSIDKLPALGSQIKVKSLNLGISVSPGTISSNFDFELTVTIRDETSFIYSESLTTILTAPSSSLLTSSAVSISGLSKFTFHYSHSGTYSIQVSCMSFIKTYSIIVNQDNVIISNISPKVNFI